MATKAEVSSRVDAAVALMDAGDWSGALTKLLGASAILSTLADQAFGGDQLRYDRMAINELIEQCKQKAATQAAGSGAGGIQRTKLRFGGLRPSDCED